jgi:hypothetical protein
MTPSRRLRFERLVEPGVVLPLLFLMTLISALTLTVNPWPRDDWFESHEVLFATSPGSDNYVPVSVPALLYQGGHWIAAVMGFDLRGEMYVDVMLQNLLLFLSACFVYHGLRAVDLRTAAGPVAVLYLGYLLCMGVAQAMWSETAALFLFAGALYLNLALYRDGGDGRFWRRSAWSAVLIGLLVVTRVTPVFLIPAVAVLLWTRLDRPRLIGHLLLASVTAVGLVLLLMWSNEWRYGRFELTSSSGRHLWQGVAYMSEENLAAKPEFAALRRLNPQLRGKNWWEIDLPADMNWLNGGDDLLNEAAKAAMRKDPVEYLALGVEKFATDAFTPVYRLGFGLPHGHPDPLDLDEPLPAPGSLDGRSLGRLTALLSAFSVRAFELSLLLFPVAVFLVVTTPSCSLFQRSRRRAPRALGHLLVGLGLVWVMVWSRALVLSPALFALCGVVMAGQLAYLALVPLEGRAKAGPLPDFDGRVYLVMAAMYFGSIGFSWMIEMSNARNVVPYLPFLATLGACALTHWVRALRRVRATLFRDAAY